MKKTARSDAVNACLDEIDAAHAAMRDNKLDKAAVGELKGWVRKQKAKLKALKYSGRVGRKTRRDSKSAN